MSTDAASFPGRGQNMNGDVIDNGFPQPAAPPREVIDEDSLIWKILTLLPIFGMIPQAVQEISLAATVSSAILPISRERLVAIIDVKNDYKIAGIIRHVLTIALIVVGVALSVLSPISLVLPLLLYTGIDGCITWPEISHNRALIERLRAGDNLPRGTMIR